MTKRDMMDVVLKLFGVYFFVTFVKTIPMTLIQFTVELPSDVFPNPSAYLILNFLHSLFPLVFAYFFLFRSQAIAAVLVKEDAPRQDAAGRQPAYAQLRVWIIMIGLYYFVSSAGDLLNHVVKLFRWGRHYAPGHVIQFASRDLIPSIVIFLLSLIFIFSSKWIEDFIKRKTGNNTQPEDGQLSSESAPGASSDEVSS